MVDMNRSELQKRLLENVGFSNKKASVYLSLLEAGEITASELAKKANIKRTTVYNIIPELLEEGFIKTTKQGGKQYYFVENVHDLYDRLNEKLVRTRSIIPELERLHSAITNHPEVTFYEGIGSLKKFYQDLLNEMSPGEEILSVIGASELAELMPMDLVDWYTKQRITKKIKHRIIGTESSFIKKQKEGDEKSLRETRILPKSDLEFSGDMRIYRNKVSFVSFKENFFGIVYSSKEIYKLQKLMFEQVWKSLE